MNKNNLTEICKHKQSNHSGSLEILIFKWLNYFPNASSLVLQCYLIIWNRLRFRFWRLSINILSDDYFRRFDTNFFLTCACLLLLPVFGVFCKCLRLCRRIPRGVSTIHDLLSGSTFYYSRFFPTLFGVYFNQYLFSSQRRKWSS